jgi:tRNA uracil 4-sulfurtransferase
MNNHEILYLLKIGELVLKGDNRSLFEKQLRRNIRAKLPACSVTFVTQKGRMYLRATKCSREYIEQALVKTAGLKGFALAVSVKKTIEAVTQAVLKMLAEQSSFSSGSTFKVNSRRADKSFPLSSYEICCAVGDAVLKQFPETRVQMKEAQIEISIEIRNKAYIYTAVQKGPGGLPVGTAGKGLLLLSGGIDSPVAAYRMALRGLRQDAVHFHAYPYTSNEALEKVKTLARILSEYIPGIRLYVVPFTDIQLEINRYARTEEHTLMMRCAMIRIANKIAAQIYAKVLITGEALSQVASQTIESLTLTDSVSDLLIIRPLIGSDKEEIISLANEIGTYETSILPYEDCCTIFSPVHPLVKPEKDEVAARFRSLKLDEMINDASEAALSNGNQLL